MQIFYPVYCRQFYHRFLHVRMLLFRPTLSKYCAVRDNAATDHLISVNDLLPQRVALQCSIICVKAAQESIELIYSNVPTDGTGGPLPAWWYNILCRHYEIHTVIQTTDSTRCLYCSDGFDRKPLVPCHPRRSH